MAPKWLSSIAHASEEGLDLGAGLNRIDEMEVPHTLWQAVGQKLGIAYRWTSVIGAFQWLGALGWATRDTSAFAAMAISVVNPWNS